MGLNIAKNIKWLIKQIPLMITAALMLALIGAGIGVAILLRMFDLDMGAIVIPALIIEVFTAYFAYQFASNFFPKESRSPEDLEYPNGK
ncbi:hypothetical protein GF325_10900 [Candidatus Bathyarchaeota archaeon]|nr:hypothetical protein [Candidatus Bathyarchaeota archaeon]